MIRINLLPATTTTTQKQINPVVMISSTVLPLVVILALIYMPLNSKRNHLQSQLISLQNEVERYKPIIAQVESLEQAKTQLQQRKNLIQQLENERLRYPQFMDDFLKLLPGNIWLSNLSTTITSDTTMTISMDVTAMDNYAIADLVSNFENSQIFTDVDLGPISVSQAATGQTMNFHINTIYRRTTGLDYAVKKS